MGYNIAARASRQLKAQLLASAIGLLLPLLSVAATQQIPLEKLFSSPTMTLTCVSDEQSVSVPVPDRWAVSKVTLNLHYTASNNLIGDIAQLAVKLNDIPVSQVKMNTASPDVTVQVSLPAKYIEPGYNKLSFMVVQHFLTKECERPCSPDLWTTLNMKDSFLDVEYDEKAVPLTLSSVSDFLFDPKIFPEAHINLVIEDRSAAALTVAGITASGIARRFDYRKVLFSVSRDIAPGVDNVVIGRKAFVSDFLGGHGLHLGTVNGGHLKLFPLPGENGTDPTHALLVVTGEQYDHVKLAAETLASMSYGFPGADELNAYQFKMPDIPAYGGREVIQANKSYDFKTLNFPTTTFQGINPTGKDINFRLPVDFLIRQNQSAKLALHFAYGAGMRDSSALNILVNGKILKGIHLGDKDGGYFENYEIDIPTYLFKPGQNRISFGIELQPQLKECDLALLGNMFVTIFDNSKLTFPDMPHFVELPKLELFMLNGFPFTRWPDGYESKVYLSETDDASLSATLNIVGLMTQKNGFPLIGLQIDPEPPKDWKGELLLIGPPNKIPKEYKDNSPLFIGDRANIPYPVVRDWEGEYTIAHSQQASQLGGDRGYLMEFQSPFQSGRTVMVVAAENGNNLLKLSKLLLEPEIQAQTQGGFLLVDMLPNYAKPKVASFGVGTIYTTGKSGSASKLESYLYANPTVYYALLGLLTAGFAIALYWALQRYRATRKLGRSSGR